MAKRIHRAFKTIRSKHKTTDLTLFPCGKVKSGNLTGSGKIPHRLTGYCSLKPLTVQVLLKQTVKNHTVLQLFSPVKATLLKCSSQCALSKDSKCTCFETLRQPLKRSGIISNAQAVLKRSGIIQTPLLQTPLLQTPRFANAPLSQTLRQS